jgi:16S rRNA (uracil1498-N3)-methyltransferase
MFRMRLHRFYISGGVVETGEGLLHDQAIIEQVRSVFRLRAGNMVVFFDGSGPDRVCEIVSMSKEGLSYRVTETRPAVPPASVRLALAVSMVKKDTFEWIVQKGTELGVSEFIPVISDRSEKKGFNMERMKKICIEAVEQSGRGDVPTIREPQALDEYLSAEKRPLLAFHTENVGGEKEIQNFSQGLVPAGGELVALIGPEGGWTENEVAAFRTAGATIVKLNTPILRAETAAIAVATLVLAA